MACKCIVCGVDSKSPNNIRSFHRIPKDDDVKKQWRQVLQNIGCKSIYSSTVVCSDHFAPTDFHISISSTTRRRLLSTAVPKYNLGDEKITNSNCNSTVILNKESITSNEANDNVIKNFENDYIEESQIDIKEEPLMIDDNVIKNSNNQRNERSNIENDKFVGLDIDIKEEPIFDSNIITNSNNKEYNITCNDENNHDEEFKIDIQEDLLKIDDNMMRNSKNKRYEANNIENGVQIGEFEVIIKEESIEFDDVILNTTNKRHKTSHVENHDIAFEAVIKEEPNNEINEEVNVNLSNTGTENDEDTSINLTKLPRMNHHGGFIYYHQKMSLDKIIDFMKESTGAAANYAVHVFPDAVPVTPEKEVERQLKNFLTVLPFQQQMVKHTPVSGLCLNNRLNCNVDFDKLREILKACTTGEGVPWSVTVATKKYKEIIESITFDRNIPIYTLNIEHDPKILLSHLEKIPCEIKVEQDPLKILNEDVTIPKYNLSSSKSFSEMHLEGGFCNLMRWGMGDAYRLWLFVPPEYTQDLNAVSQGALHKLQDSDFKMKVMNDWKSSCYSPLLHKKMLLSPDFLEDHKIPSEVIIQKPGTLIYVQGSLFYQVVNSGINLTESILVDNSFCDGKVTKCNCEGKIESIFKSKDLKSLLSQCEHCGEYYVDKKKNIGTINPTNPEPGCKKCPICLYLTNEVKCPTCKRFFSPRGIYLHRRACFDVSNSS